MQLPLQRRTYPIFLASSKRVEGRWSFGIGALGLDRPETRGQGPFQICSNPMSRACYVLCVTGAPPPSLTFLDPLKYMAFLHSSPTPYSLPATTWELSNRQIRFGAS